MVHSTEPSDFNPNISVLDQLAHRIREARQAAQQAGAALLHHTLDAGDALNEAQTRVSTGWKRWLRDNCFLSVRTAFVYQQLANHRTEIEAAIGQAGELSLRAALRLIAPPRSNKPKPAKTKNDALAWWSNADNEMRQQLLDRIGLVSLLTALSPGLRKELERRVANPQGSGNVHSHSKLTAAFRTALSHLAVADAPQTSGPVAQSQELAALNALRGITRMRAEFHDLTVSIQRAEKVRRRRAA
jgi:hypothetical protein